MSDTSGSGGRRIALVTGAARGIGKGIAEALASDCDLILGYNSDVAAAQATTDELASRFGARCVCVGGDITMPETRDKFFEVVDREFGGKMHVLVHNAGQYVGVTSTNAHNLPESRGLRFGDGSLLGADGKTDFTTMRYYMAMYGEAWVDLAERCLKRMVDGESHIVGISSPGCNAISRPNDGYAMPGSGKCLMEYSMRLYALAAAPRGINVNVVIPGVTLSDAWKRLSAHIGGGEGDFAIATGLADTVPMRRAASTREMGDVVAFLCSRAGSYVTGVSLPVDGGLHMGRNTGKTLAAARKAAADEAAPATATGDAPK
eukprot:TRINITY_DN4643_c0_g1_i1.p1 TRINITY_DN4643_c0_g1~~TRINITY_DN4643_c0_g1_i1.p1  ORF type:complete len:332 (-),score=110.30 TRINITY_DN4643_c0_g1_i1:365-1318(-)